MNRQETAKRRKPPDKNYAIANRVTKRLMVLPIYSPKKRSDAVMDRLWQEEKHEYYRELYLKGGE